MVDLPQRIQLSRAKGWRLPAGAVSVARPGPDGNFYRVIQEQGGWAVTDSQLDRFQARDRADAHALAVSLYSRWIRGLCEADPQAAELMFARLRGKPLACWCPPGLACHADVLLELANAPLRCEPA